MIMDKQMDHWIKIIPACLILAACSKLPVAAADPEAKSIKDFQAVELDYTLPDDVASVCQPQTKTQPSDLTSEHESVIGCPSIDIQLVSLEPKWVQDSLNFYITQDHNPERIKFRRHLDTFARQSMYDNGVMPYYQSVEPQFVGMHGTLAQFAVLDDMYLGGAHGMQTTTYYIYDLALGTQISLYDLEIQSYDKEAGRLYELTQAAYDRYLYAHRADIGDPEEYKETYPLEYTDNFYFNDQGLVLYYNPYVLSPYAMGPVELIIPFVDLEGVLRAEYLPPFD